MSGGNKSLSVESGQDFIVQLSDFTSTGYRWFFDEISGRERCQVQRKQDRWRCDFTSLHERLVYGIKLWICGVFNGTCQTLDDA